MDSVEVVDKFKFNKDKPKKVSLREERSILEERPKLREEFWSFATKRLRLVSGLGNKV